MQRRVKRNTVKQAKLGDVRLNPASQFPEVLRAVAGQHLDATMNDWVIMLTCGHEIHVSNRYGYTEFTEPRWCCQCGRAIDGGLAH